MNPLLKMPNIQLNATELQYIPWRTVVNAVGMSLMEPTADPSKGYRPKQWQGGKDTQMFYMEWNDFSGSGAFRNYFFDAVLRTEHLSTRRATQHPIQTGANITDHSFQIPSTLTMEIGVSDVMDVIDTNWNWNQHGTSVKSVNAYQDLILLQKSGLPLTIVTRLNSYENMIIESISAIEEYRTINELRASIRFVEIMIAGGVGVSKESIDPHQSSVTQNGVNATTQIVLNLKSGNKSAVNNIVTNQR